MSNLKAGVVIFLLGGCASSYRIPRAQIEFPSEKPVRIEHPFIGITVAEYKLLRIEKIESGDSMTESRRAFLLDFYRQSKDPYFGSNRWSDECLRRNRIGEITQNSNGVSFRSQLTADVNLKTGICTQDSIDVVQLVGYCKSSRIFYDFVLTGKNSDRFTFECPDKLVVP